MRLTKVNCFNYLKYIDKIQNELTYLLSEDVSFVILKFLHDVYYKQLLEVQTFRSKIHRIDLDFSLRHFTFGLKFSGARNMNHADKKRAGIFISDIKENSPAYELFIKDSLDYRGFQVLRYNFLNNPRTLKQYKKYIKERPSATISLKLGWNQDLLDVYEYNPNGKK